MIRTLIFDLGRVLISFDFQIGYQLMSRHCGLPPEEIRRRLMGGTLVHDYESGRISDPDFHRAVEAALETTIPFEHFCEMWRSIFHEGTLIPESFLETLHQRYRLVLLSNTNGLHFGGLRGTRSILRHFDAYILSHEVQAMKPSPVIYAAAIEAAGCAPEECFFTDDIEAYVEGACQAGIQAVQFQGFDKLQAELRARGVEW